MIKIKTIPFVLVFLVFCFFGCEQNKKAKIEMRELKCISTQTPCLIKSPSGNFSVLFNIEPVVTENPFDIVLISESKYSIQKVSAYMEGKNMFMGKIPLFFELKLAENEPYYQGQKMRYVANTMLGSCSEENMRWIILFEVILDTPQGKNIIERFSVEFDSVQAFNEQ
ncbi:hypothetical protein ACM9HF_03895 [Colwellia sp. RE-S-Sl-9]